MHTKNKKYALRSFDYILLMLFTIFICVITTSKIIEDDVFIHLVTGKYIVENKTIPAADMFGYVTEGTYWVTYEWLWQAASFIIWQLGDYVLLSVLRTFIVILIFLIFYLFFKKNKISIQLFIFFGIILCFQIMGRLVIRPHLISYLCLVFLVSALFYCKAFGFQKRVLLYSIPFVFLVWVNIHMGVILGLVIFALFLFSETITYAGRKGFFRNTNRILTYNELKIFYKVFALSVAAVLVNPQFIGAYAYIYGLMTMPELSFINEWGSPFEERFIYGYYVGIYFVFLLFGLIILFYSVKKRELFPAVLYIVIGIFSTRSLRYTSDFVIVIFIPLIISMNYYLKNIKTKVTFPNTQIVNAAVSIVLIFLTVNFYNNDIYRYMNVPFRETGFGISQKYFPVCLFEFMKINKICDTGSRPFNSMRVGGYFLWSFEGKKNFADNRCLSGNIIKEYLDISLYRDNFSIKLKEYDIDYIIINIPDINTVPVEIQFNLPAYLAKNPEWKLIYWDDKSFLFVRNEPKFSDVISKFEYKYLTPSNCLFHKNVIVNALKTDSKRVIDELSRRMSEDKNGVIINDIAKYLNHQRLAAVYMNNH